jgi:hypothetical protein
MTELLSSRPGRGLVPPVRGTVATLLLALGCAAAQRGEGLDPNAVPPAMRADYELFADRCTRCHSISRSLSARVHDRAHWVNYVERMRRQPGAMITAEEGERIVGFLVWFHDEARDGGAR